MDINEIREFIKLQSKETKVYIGTDSECIQLSDGLYADYTLAIVVHINGNNGCKVFGEVQREKVYDSRKDKPALRLMNEVYKVADLFQKLQDDLEDRIVEVHLDINPNDRYGSNCVFQQAVGYIKGTCNLSPKVKPEAFAASYAADRMKSILYAH